VWGFIIDYERIFADVEIQWKGSNLDRDQRRNLLQSRVIKVLSELESECDEIWDCHTTGTVETSVQGTPTTLMAIVKCTRRNDKFLPPPDKVEELKKVFVMYGFGAEPGWFIGTHH